jgi:hypothetical protein
MFKKIIKFLFSNFNRIEKIMKILFFLVFIILTIDSFLYHSLYSFIKEFISLLILFIFIIFSYKNITKKIKKRKKIIQRYLLLDIITISISAYMILIYSTFFVFYPNFFYNENYTKTENKNLIKGLDEITKNDLNAFTSYNKNTYKQPINIIIITEKNIEDIMKKMNWEKVATFSKNDITFLDYISGFIENNLPMTDSYFLNTVQNLAYQKNSKLYRREHVSFWNFKTENNKNIYISSITEDIEFAFKNHHGLLVPSHKIDPNTDKIRDKFKTEIQNNFSEVKIENFKQNINQNQKSYYTNGEIILVYL